MVRFNGDTKRPCLLEDPRAEFVGRRVFRKLRQLLNRVLEL
jgi:hypothetical protein